MTEPPIAALVRRSRRQVQGLALLSIPVAALFCLLVEPLWLQVTLVAGVFALAASWCEHWLTRLQPRHLARHLDRAYPELEDSCELLIRPAQTMAETLQADRIGRRLGALVGDPGADLRGVLPGGARRSGVLIVTFCAVLLAATQVNWPTAGESRQQVSGAAGLQLHSILVQPPAYTGLLPLQPEQLDFTAPQGSRIRWRVALPPQAHSLTWVPDTGDVVTARQRPDGNFEVAVDLQRAVAYRFSWQRNGAGERSQYHGLEMTPDRPPELVVEQPRQSPLSISPEQAPVAGFQVVASDDYGLGQALILATVASGQGENVRFREAEFAFDSAIAAAGHGQLFSRRWDLPALGMTPGDELYFQALICDQRQPRPNCSRSAMQMLRWISAESRAGLALEGIAVDLLPEYFRSQRQIIIDTELLLAEQDEIPVAEGFRRLHNLALDQKALRLRYGQYLGEEYSSDIGPAPPQPDELAPEHAEESLADHMAHAAETSHGHDSAESGPLSATVASLPDFMSEYVHAHDSAEQATLFDQKTRAMLKAALSAMWDAELELHLRNPAAALPHENLALDRLKAVQQANRIYVRRAGFEPAPLDEGIRLRGELEQLGDGTAQLRSDPQDEHWQSLWRRLEAVDAGPLPPDLAVELLDLTQTGEDAGHSLDHGLDDSLDDSLQLRLAVARLKTASPDCEACRQSIRAFLWRRLPQPRARADVGAADGSAGLGADYFRQLEQSP